MRRASDRVTALQTPGADSAFPRAGIPARRGSPSPHFPRCIPRLPPRWLPGEAAMPSQIFSGESSDSPPLLQEPGGAAVPTLCRAGLGEGPRPPLGAGSAERGSHLAGSAGGPGAAGPGPAHRPPLTPPDAGGKRPGSGKSPPGCCPELLIKAPSSSRSRPPASPSQPIKRYSNSLGLIGFVLIAPSTPARIA